MRVHISWSSTAMSEHQEPAALRNDRIRAEIARRFAREPESIAPSSDEAALLIAYELTEMNRKLDRLVSALEQLVRAGL
jgi:hypothetical protein